MNKIKLGDEVRDKVTGLTGIATTKVEFLNGCVQYQVQPPVDKEGKMVEAEYIDDSQLEKVKKEKPKRVKTDTGGGFHKYPKNGM